MPFKKSLTFAVFLFFFLLNSVSAENAIKVAITDNQGEEYLQIHRKSGEFLSLNCSLTVPNKGIYAVIKWLKNGVLLSASNTTDGWFVRNISNVTQADGGYYECKALYGGGVSSKGVFVNIEGKPVVIDCCDRKWFTGNPQYILAGDTRTFKCYATGWPLPTFKWLFDGNELDERIGRQTEKYELQTTKHGMALKLNYMVKQNEGQYTCQASNSYGKDSYSVKVTIFGAKTSPPEIRAVLSNIHASHGQPNVTLTCIGTGVREVNSDTKWFYNGKELLQKDKNNTHLVYQTDYYDQNTLGVTRKVKMLLTIVNVTKYDNGNYTCKVYVNDKAANDTISLAVGKSDSNIPKSHEPKILPLAVVLPLAIGSAMIVIAIIAVAIVYRYKRKVDPPKIPEGPFKYGAFITYSSQDYGWVKANLLPFLKDNGIETCIHYRNFDVGVLLEQNIVNCVYTSRVVIAVMSRNYMKSKYCRSELDYAIHRSVEEPDSNPLITLKIDKQIKQKQLPIAIRKKTFLDVTSEVEKENWKQRLLVHIKGKQGDLNRNDINREDNHVDDENVALMDPDRNGN